MSQEVAPGGPEDDKERIGARIREELAALRDYLLRRFRSLDDAFDALEIFSLSKKHRITLLEFQDSLVRSWKYCDARSAKHIFFLLDTDRNGTLSPAELRRVLLGDEEEATQSSGFSPLAAAPAEPRKGQRQSLRATTPGTRRRS